MRWAVVADIGLLVGLAQMVSFCLFGMACLRFGLVCVDDRLLIPLWKVLHFLLSKVDYGHSAVCTAYVISDESTCRFLGSEFQPKTILKSSIRGSKDAVGSQSSGNWRINLEWAK